MRKRMLASGDGIGLEMYSDDNPFVDLHPFSGCVIVVLFRMIDVHHN